jgi:hypothetical protein
MLPRLPGAAEWLRRASSTQVSAGSDPRRAVTPAALAASIYGTAIVEIECFKNSEDIAVGDDAADGYWRVPSELNGWNLVEVAGHVGTAATGSGSETTDIMVHNVTQAVDMLTVALTIDEDETDSSTADAGPTIDTSNDDVGTGDLLRLDVDAVPSTTPGSGLVVTLKFRRP